MRHVPIDEKRTNIAIKQKYVAMALSEGFNEFEDWIDYLLDIKKKVEIKMSDLDLILQTLNNYYPQTKELEETKNMIISFQLNLKSILNKDKPAMLKSKKEE